MIHFNFPVSHASLRNLLTTIVKTYVFVYNLHANITNTSFIFICKCTPFRAL